MGLTSVSSKYSRSAWLLLTLASIGVLGIVDYLTGPEVSFSVFYLLPVSVAAWYTGFAGGFAAAVFSAVIWFLADYFWAVSYSHPFIPYWNALVRFMFFILTVWLICRTKALNRSLDEKAASLARQVAERIRAEEALAESQKFYRLITDNASDLIAVLDAHGRQLYCSPSYHRIFDEPEPRLGLDYFDRIHPEDQEKARTAFRETVETGRNQRVEYRICRTGGPVRYFESEWNLILETASAGHNVVVVSRDITQRKRTELLYANEKEILESIAQSRPLQAVLRALVGKIESWSDRLFCSILVQNADGEAVLHEASTAVLDLGGASARTADEPAEGANCSLQPREEWARYQEAALAAGLDIACSKEILSTSGEVLGHLTIFSRGEQQPEALRLQLFEKAANVTAIALERQRSEQMLRRLSNLILNAQEAERRRVARDLHDSVNQILSSAAFRVESVLGQSSAENRPMWQELGKVRFLLQKAIHEVRHISEDLRPSELDELGLLPALRALCNDFRDRNQWAVHCQFPSDRRRFSSELELALYRIVQEAFTNIQKHSGARKVGLALNWENGFVSLTVRDDGRGLAAGARPGREGKKLGMGLIDMRERCAFLGGSFSIRSGPDGGTEISVKIPVSPAELRT